MTQIFSAAVMNKFLVIWQEEQCKNISFLPRYFSKQSPHFLAIVFQVVFLIAFALGWFQPPFLWLLPRISTRSHMKSVKFESLKTLIFTYLTHDSNIPVENQNDRSNENNCHQEGNRSDQGGLRFLKLIHWHPFDVNSDVNLKSSKCIDELHMSFIDFLQQYKST